MKKFVKVLGLMAVALCLGFTLVACGSDEVEGTYEGTMGEGEYAVTITLELKDGKAKQTMTVSGQTQTVEGTYTVDGDKITISAGSISSTVTYKDGKITVPLGDEGEIVLTKK